MLHMSDPILEQFLGDECCPILSCSDRPWKLRHFFIWWRAIKQNSTNPIWSTQKLKGLPHFAWVPHPPPPEIRNSSKVRCSYAKTHTNQLIQANFTGGIHTTYTYMASMIFIDWIDNLRQMGHFDSWGLGYHENTYPGTPIPLPNPWPSPTLRVDTGFKDIYRDRWPWPTATYRSIYVFASS